MPIEPTEPTTNEISTQSDREIWDVAIVGGGLAGGAAAFHLAQHGLKVILFEKEKHAHHKVCGEFLSGEALPLLNEMGLDLPSLGAQGIHQFRLHGPHKTGEAKLPLAALGFSREALDDLILKRATGAGAHVRRGVFVRGQIKKGSSRGLIELDTSEGSFHAKRLVIATGKYEFSSTAKRYGRDSGLVGFKMHLKLKPSAEKILKDHCDLFVFDGVYGGLSLIENGLANFCFLIEKSKLKKLKADWDHLATHIAHTNQAASHYIDGAVPQFDKFVTVARVPYGFLRNAKVESGVFCVGDQMAVIPSLSGDGMTIALQTGVASARAIIAPGQPGEMLPASTAFQYQKKVRKALRTQIESAYLIHRLFKNPRICDLAARAIETFPAVLDFVFTSTRCHVTDQLPGSNSGAEGLLQALKLPRNVLGVGNFFRPFRSKQAKIG